jgi:hypothetical protein
MFISGLTVAMGAPPADFVNEYFDGFHANAVHLWQDGLPTEMDGWAAVGRQDFRFVSWVLNNGTSIDGGQLAGGYPANPPGRIGYQIGDEPRTWQHLMQIETGFEALRAHDPDALLILNFSFLAEQITEMLQYYGEQIDGDIVSYDHYTRSNSSYENLERFRRAGLDHEMPYWRYVKSYLGEPGDAISESDMRWDAFSGLVYGYTGHTWFLYQIAINPDLDPALFVIENQFDAQKTSLWAVGAQINVEMANLGRAITQLTSTDVRYIPTLDFYLPPGTTAWEPGAGGDPYITSLDKAPGELLLEILAGFFLDDAGELYVMVQNVRHDHGDFPVNNSNPGTIQIVFDFSSAPQGFDKTLVVSLNKLTGQVEEIPLTSSQGDQGTLDLTLDAGDPFLFKYATGAPFALQ